MDTARDFASRLLDLLRNERAAMADFLAALADFDARRLWIRLGHTSLFTFLHRDLTRSPAAGRPPPRAGCFWRYDLRGGAFAPGYGTFPPSRATGAPSPGRRQRSLRPFHAWVDARGMVGICPFRQGALDMSHDTAHGHDSHAHGNDAHGHDSHGHDAHGHGSSAADIADGPTGGPFGWPFALLVGLFTLGASLWALLTPR